jgi:hypothetical protein
VSGSRHARKSLGEGEAGLAARGPFHWPSQNLSVRREAALGSLGCCGSSFPLLLLRPSSRVRRRAESSRETLANHCAIPAIYEDREFVDVGGLMSCECISSNRRVYRPSTKLLAIADNPHPASPLYPPGSTPGGRRTRRAVKLLQKIDARHVAARSGDTRDKIATPFQRTLQV